MKPQPLSGPNDSHNPDPSRVQDQNPNQLGGPGWRVEVNDELRERLGRFLCVFSILFISLHLKWVPKFSLNQQTFMKTIKKSKK